MKNVSIEDLKTLHRIFKTVEDRGSELIYLKSDLGFDNCNNISYVHGISEVLEDQIVFYCDEEYNGVTYKYITFEEILNDGYLEHLKKLLEEKQEKERLEKEKLEEEKIKTEEQKEKELYEKLKAKYDK